MSTDVAIRRLAWSAIVGGIALTALTLAAFAVPSVRLWFAGTVSLEPSYAVGESIDVPAGVYSEHAATLLVFASASCGVCQESRPALLKLAAAIEPRTDAGVALFMSASHSDQGREFAGSIGLLNSLNLVDVAKLRVKRVPTLAVVNSSGAVTYAWQGLVTEEVSREVLQAMASAGGQGD